MVLIPHPVPAFDTRQSKMASNGNHLQMDIASERDMLRAFQKHCTLKHRTL